MVIEETRTNQEETLENKIAARQQALTEAGFSASDAIAILPLEHYVMRFIRNYHRIESFRNDVHKYINLSGIERFKLGAASIFLPSWHKKTTNAMIEKYATHIRTDLERIVEVQKELIALQGEQESEKDKAEYLQITEQEKIAIEQKKYQVEVEKDLEKRRIEDEMQKKLLEEQERAEREKALIEEKTNAEAIVKARLEEQLLSIPGIVQTDRGIEFDDTKMAQSLEEIFLDEIVSDIEREENPGFMYRLKQLYDGAITHYEEITDPSELPRVDWMQSAILSRMRGYRRPVFPHLVVGRGEEYKKIAVNTIDTAIALDISGSMDENSRFAIAQKATLALHALMRRQNPENKTSLAVYNSVVQQVTTAQLMKDVKPYNGTGTEKAIEWLVTTLSESPLGIAYLITDGAPNNQQATIDSAKKFREHDNLLFRIFLIDGNSSTEEITRQVGYAAGQTTKVLPVKNYRLANGLIKDVADALGDMTSIGTF